MRSTNSLRSMFTAISFHIPSFFYGVDEEQRNYSERKDLEKERKKLCCILQECQENNLCCQSFIKLYFLSVSHLLIIWIIY